MTSTHEHIEGFETPIHRGVWERICTFGAPRVWSAVWLVTCLYAALIFLSVLGFRWVMVPLGAWAVGQGTLVVLTQWDVHWDDLAIAQVTRRYREYYDAG